MIVTWIIFACSLLISSYVFAIPSHTPHTHDNQTIEWEADGTEDGSASHNHRSTVQDKK